MNNSINTNGLSFRLQDDGSLLITTPTGQHQVQPQGVADLFDLLSAGQGDFWMHRPICLHGRENVLRIVSLLDMSRSMRKHHNH